MSHEIYLVRFRPQVVEKLIHDVLIDSLNDKQYTHEQCKAWTEQIGDTIKAKLKGDELALYLVMAVQSNCYFRVEPGEVQVRGAGGDWRAERGGSQVS